MRAFVLVLACCTALAPPASRAQDAAPSAPIPPATSPASAADSVNASLASLADGMAELVALMKRQVEQVDLSLAMKRVELSTFLLIEANRQIESRKQEREMMEQSLASTEEQINDMNDVLPKDTPEASLEELQDQRKFIARMETALAQQKEQVKRLDLQLVEYESQAASHRDEINRWQDVVDDYFARAKP